VSKILIVRQKYTPYGGAERAITGILNALGMADVEILTRSWDGETSHKVHSCNPFYLGRYWRDRSFHRAACRFINNDFQGLVQSHERIPCCDIYRAGDGVHKVWLQHYCHSLKSSIHSGMVRHNAYHRYIIKAEEGMYASRRLRAVICNSQMVKEDILENFNYPEEQIHVIHNGVNHEKFNPDLRCHRKEVRERLGIPQTAVVYLFVGSGYWRKGLPWLFAAFKRMANPNAWLLVVGKENKKQYYRTAKEIGQICMAGAQTDMGPFYGCADVMVQPSLYDPFPNTTLEAMAAGLPVIVSNSCGTRDLINHGENGLLFDAMDDVSLSLHMDHLLDSGVQNLMGEAAHQTAVLMLQPEQMAKDYRDLYTKVIEAMN